MSKTLVVYEVFSSIMGEYNAFGQGRKATFVRLAGCNLSCSYCDTEVTQSMSHGTEYSIPALRKTIENLGNSVVCITGGEPLLQEEVEILIKELAYTGYEVVLETNGTKDVTNIAAHCNVIMDWKLEAESLMLRSNLPVLSPVDAIKFVISSKQEFQRACEVTYSISGITDALIVFSPNLNKMSASELFSLFNEQKFDCEVLFSLQIHKVIGCK